MADPNEMRAQARALRGEANEFDSIAATLRSALDPEAMVGPAADRLRERLVDRASTLQGAADRVRGMAATLERAAIEVELEQQQQRGMFSV